MKLPAVGIGNVIETTGIICINIVVRNRLCVDTDVRRSFLEKLPETVVLTIDGALDFANDLDCFPVP